MRNSARRQARLGWGIALCLITQLATAQAVLNNGKLRFGNGTEASVNNKGTLQQPFYYDAGASTFYKLTFSNYPLDIAVGAGGAGATQWNIDGDIVENAVLTGQTVDSTGFTPTSGNVGYGTLISTGTSIVGTANLEVRNTYELTATDAFVKITTRVTNTGGAPVNNLRVWVGTRDDFVGSTDTPTKTRGTLSSSGFSPITDPATRAPALQITSGAQGVLFYSTSSRAYTAINGCCQFRNVYHQDPATSQNVITNDGSYALFVRMNDLAPGASDEFTWYYAAGAIADLNAIIGNLASQLRFFDVTASANTGGTITPATSSVAEGASTQFTVTPSAGYHIDSVQGCAGSLSGNTYTTGAINAACSVNATFAPDASTVSTSVGPNGGIAPTSAQVANGSNATFTLTPNTGYEVSSATGCGGSLVGTTYTTGAVSADCTVTVTFDLAPPTFQNAEQLQTYVVSSSSLLTSFPAGARPTAVDYQNGAATVTLTNGSTDVRYAPGTYELIWQAVDSRGVTQEFRQTLQVLPTVNFGPDLSIGARAGNSDSFRIALNGVSPVPLTVNYTVSGDASGTTLENGQVTFQGNEVEKQIPFAVTATSPTGSSERTVQVALDPQLNRGSDRSLNITLTTVNQAPRVNLQIAQNGQQQIVAARDAGSITLSVDIQDADTTDAHTVEWRAPSGAVYTVNGDSLVVDPASLQPGVHRFEVIVTDNGTPPNTTRRTFDVVVLPTAPTLPAGATQFLPNGLPDSPLYAPVAPNVLPERGGQLSSHLMEADAGTRLSLGAYARYRSAYQTELPGTTSSFQIPDDGVLNHGGYFDFVVDDLPRAGDSVSVVIPQRAPIPDMPVYRKYDPATNSWRTFSEDNDNRLASAPGEEGFCPPTTSSDYRTGLSPGDWCVRLTIKDGGANDADGAVNGSVSDPGGVGSLSAISVTGKSSGGGGSLDIWMLLLFASLLLLKMQRRRLLAMGLLSVVALQANAADVESTSWYVGGTFGSARSYVTASRIDRALASEGYAVTSNVSNKSRSAGRVYGGYEFTPWLSLEGGYSDLGDVKVEFAGFLADIDQFLVDANALQPPSAKGYDASLVGRLRFATRWAVFARAGAFFWDAKYETRSVGGQYIRRKDDGSSSLAGIGIQAQLTRHWTLNAEFTRYGIDGDHIDFGGVGAVLRW
jgi:hypothetical protein